MLSPKGSDCFITGYRCHAHMVTRGEPMLNIFSELLETLLVLQKEKVGPCTCLEKKIIFWRTWNSWCTSTNRELELHC